MFGKIIGAVAGSKLAETVSGVGGGKGALLGVGAATIARRLSLPMLVAVTAGGYLAKKYIDKKEQGEPAEPTPPEVKKDMAPSAA